MNDRSHPFFIFVATHLKSQLDRDRIDPNGAERRTAEFRTLLKIYEELRSKWSPAVPIAIAGDFNGNASRRGTDNEFTGLYDQEILSDVCDLAGLSPENSATYYQIGRQGRSDGKQLDYCFLSPEASPFLVKTSVKVFRYLDHLGSALPPPSTLEAKGQLPSDHYPLVFELRDIPLR